MIITSQSSFPFGPDLPCVTAAEALCTRFGIKPTTLQALEWFLHLQIYDTEYE